MFHRALPVVACGVFFLYSTPVIADRGPRPSGGAPKGLEDKREQSAKLLVEVDRNSKRTILQIPRSLFNNEVKREVGAGKTHLPTLVAGLALTAAFVSGGFWLVRRGAVRGKIAGAFALVALCLSGAALWADIGPRPGSRPRPPFVLPTGVKLPADVVLRFVENGDLKLIVAPQDVIGGNVRRPGAAEPRPE